MNESASLLAMLTAISIPNRPSMNLLGKAIKCISEQAEEMAGILDKLEQKTNNLPCTNLAATRTESIHMISVFMSLSMPNRPTYSILEKAFSKIHEHSSEIMELLERMKGEVMQYE